MKLKIATFAALTVLGLSAQAAPFYQLESALTIKSPSLPSWDYLSVDPIRPVLYIARRADGILTYDTSTNQVTGALAGTQEGNSVTIVPELDRMFVTTTGGALVIFEHSTLKPLNRVSYGESADNTFYDPATQQLLITQGDDHQVVFADAKTYAKTGTLKYDADNLEGAVADGQGFMYVAIRDKDKVLKIDMRTHALAAEWSTPGFTRPNSVAFDRANNRLFVTTRGMNPALLVYDAATGKIVASPTIGLNNDSIVFDKETKKIYTANGWDATLVIIDQVDANNYKLAEAVSTRPWARTMALDLKTKKVYLVTAEGTVDAAKPWKAQVSPFYPNKYFKDTFTLLTYSRQ
jgi:DNA-binding beta-propeller fold protein YncE